MIAEAELRDLTVDDLQARARDLEDQLVRMRVQQSLGQLDAPAKLRGTPRAYHDRPPRQRCRASPSRERRARGRTARG